MSKEKKELKQEEIETVNGGASGNGVFYVCSKCNREYEISSVDRRETGSGCDSHYEYKCPNCGQWN